MKTLVCVHGDLADALGRSQWRLKLDSPAEAISAIEATTGGIHAYLRANLKTEFVVMVNQVEVSSSDELIMRHAEGGLQRVDIMPVVEGSGSKLAGGLMVLVGAILLIASIAIPGLSPELAKVGMTLGMGLMLSGVSTLLAPTQDEQPEARLLPSHLFDGAVNTMRQGNPVPFGAGLMEIGSQTISFGVYARAIDADEAPRRRVIINSDPGDGAACTIYYSANLEFLAGDRFECYPLTVDAEELAYGNNWATAWHIYRFGKGIVALDTFERYAATGFTTYLPKIGEDFSSRWHIYSDNIGSIVEDTFEDYEAQAVDLDNSVLYAGTNWADSWSFYEKSLGIVAFSNFEDATLGEQTEGDLAGGTGWSTYWFITTYDPNLGITASDNFESYSTGTLAYSALLEGGTGWPAAWAIWTDTVIVDTFEQLAVGAITVADGGSGFIGDWAFNDSSRLIFEDTMESYTVGGAPGSDGILFSGSWVGNTPAARLFVDDLESYTVGVSPSSGGSNWGSDWSVS